MAYSGGPAPGARREGGISQLLLTLIVLAGDVWALFEIARSGESLASRLLWALLVLALPVLGLLLWFFAGPRAKTGR